MEARRSAMRESFVVIRPEVTGVRTGADSRGRSEK